MVEAAGVDQVKARPKAEASPPSLLLSYGETDIA